MDYEAALRYLYALSPRGIELGLSRIERALALRNHPERSCPCVHVAGTNGKGSVSTTIASVLTSSGRKVGLFTSPHLHQLVERFRIAGKPVSKRALARKVTELAAFLSLPGSPQLTFFELCTLLAFELFRDARCDFMVLEVGLGGRLDSTNVVRPRVSVITGIALDHTDRLGPTIAHVAREKAGIIKPGVPVVVGARDREALVPIRAVARRRKARVYGLGRDFTLVPSASAYAFNFGGRALSSVRPPLEGAYQADNLACALAALQLLEPHVSITPAMVKRGLARVRWPGRLELLEGTPSVLCDAAHNPQACAALARHLEQACQSYPRRVLLFGVMRDKDSAAMIALLAPHVTNVVFTSAMTSRSEPPSSLAARFGGEAFDDPARALRRAQKLAGKRGLVVACGSIFVMAKVRAAVLGLAEDPPIAL